MDDTFSDWEQAIATEYNIKPIKVRTIWAVGQGILKNMRPKNNLAREYLTDSGRLTIKGKKLYSAAEKARRAAITKSLRELGLAIQNGEH